MALLRGVRFATAFEWEVLGARDSANHGISITSRPNEKTVMWERKSSLERDADVFLRIFGVRGLRITQERQHDRRRGASILSDLARAEIVEARRRGETKKVIAKRYGVSERLIYNVVKERAEVAADAVNPHVADTGNPSTRD